MLNETDMLITNWNNFRNDKNPFELNNHRLINQINLFTDTIGQLEIIIDQLQTKKNNNYVTPNVVMPQKVMPLITIRLSLIPLIKLVIFDAMP